MFLCGSWHVARKADGNRIGRWNCHACKRSFNKTRIPLQKWFLGIGLMANAKKSLSSYQLARDLDLTQPTALYMQVRIRAVMAAEERGLLRGIIGGKPRKGNKRDDDTSNKRGRGTKKIPVSGLFAHDRGLTRHPRQQFRRFELVRRIGELAPGVLEELRARNPTLTTGYCRKVLFCTAIDTMLRASDLTDHERNIKEEFNVRQRKTGVGTLA